MKHVGRNLWAGTALVAVLLGAPASVRAADAAPDQGRVVREFVTNANFADWAFQAGWTWNDGTLTHWPGTSGVVQQMSMPTLTAGKLYRITASFAERTKGNVNVSLGHATFSGYGQDGTFTLLAQVTDPQALLTLTPSTDFDGSITRLSVHELGDELFDKNAGALPDGWAEAGDRFEHTAGALSLERVVGVMSGRTYRMYFGVAKTANPPSGAVTGVASLSGPSGVSFTPDWNYALDVEATADNRLVFTPRSADGPPADWEIFAVSVREIMTEDQSAPSVTVTGAK